MKKIFKIISLTVALATLLLYFCGCERVVGYEEEKFITEDGQTAEKISSDAKDTSVFKKRIEVLYDTYLCDTGACVYLSLIPDKMYYFKGKYDFEMPDYRGISDTVKNMKFGKYIDITEILSKQSYYGTDVHWKADELSDVADKILKSMGAEKLGKIKKSAELSPFYGSYYARSEYATEPEKIVYLKTEQTDNAIVKRAADYTVEMSAAKIYYDENVSKTDAYDIFLGGACTLTEIINPLSENCKTLYIFGDSFMRSLAPLLISDYARVIIYDIRYIKPSTALSVFPITAGSDVLIMYSVTAIDTASNLRVG